MTYRVLIDPQGMKISRPGANVLTAGLQDLIFSAQDRGFTFWMTGATTVPANTWNQKTYSPWINFGTTLSKAPPILFVWREVGAAHWSNPIDTRHTLPPGAYPGTQWPVVIFDMITEVERSRLRFSLSDYVPHAQAEVRFGILDI